MARALLSISVRGIMRRNLASVLAVLSLWVGCSPSNESDRAACSDLVITPGGPAPRICVHQVPDGALVSTGSDGTSTVILNGQIVATYPPCPCGTRQPMDAASSTEADQQAAGAAACPGPLAADAGLTSLDDLPIEALCAQSSGRLIRWSTPCAGSIVVVDGSGVDCASYWLFDATTGALQATANGCNAAPRCTGGVEGFRFPAACFTDAFTTDVVRLCPTGG